MSLHKEGEGIWKVRWREAGRHRSLRVHGPYELAKKIERKKLAARDENRHLDVKKEISFRMSALLDRYEQQYARKKKSYDREKSILAGIRQALGNRFVREVDGAAVQCWYLHLSEEKSLAASTAVRHFNVMHHLLGRAATIWSEETGIDRNPADQVEVNHADDQRDRYLSQEEIPRLRQALDQLAFGANAGAGSTRMISWVFYRLRLIVLIALTTGMRISEIFGLGWPDLDYAHGLIAVRSRLKKGQMRYVPMARELAQEFQRYPAVIGEQRILAPPSGRTGRQRVDQPFQTVRELAGLENFRFHDLRHSFASWYMMNGGDLYELAKILGHANIRMTERYAKLAKQHIAKTGNTARQMWRLLENGGASGAEEAG